MPCVDHEQSDLTLGTPETGITKRAWSGARPQLRRQLTNGCELRCASRGECASFSASPE